MRTPADPPPPLAGQSDPRAGNPPLPAAKLENADQPGRMTVTGRVLDASGQPAAGVPVDIIGKPRAPETAADERMDAYSLLGQSKTEADGRFQIEATRSSSARFYYVYALAGAAGPGSGFGCAALHPDSGQLAADIRLRPEQVIRGRLVDVKGQPAAGVVIELDHVFSVSRPAGSPSFDSIGGGFNYLWDAPPAELHAWPKPVTTDELGRFTHPGIGRGLTVRLEIRDPRFARQRFEVATDDHDGPKEVTLALQPATIIEGRALAHDTGRPIPNAVISVTASLGALGGMITTKFRTDDQGRFQLNPFPGDYFRVRVFPPEGQPYSSHGVEFAWTKGAVKKELDVKLLPGIPIHGRVIEEGNGRPVAGARVQFFPRTRPRGLAFGDEAIVSSRGDGTFQVAVPPGKGYLLVLGPTLAYIPKEIGGGMLYASGQPGGLRFHAHDIIAYDVQAEDRRHELTATLRPGKTVRGRVVGPEGQTVAEAVIVCRQQIDPINLTWLGHHFIHAHDGRFELPGLDAEEPSPVYFLDAEHEWGATVELPGQQAGEDVMIRLHPCGQARARFVGPDGQPVAGLKLWPSLELIMRPGPIGAMFLNRGEPLAADAAILANVDPRHYGVPRGPLTDAEGRATLPSLIPDALYRIIDGSTRKDQAKGAQIRKDFRVRPGETLDLGEILIEKPQP